MIIYDSSDAIRVEAHQSEDSEVLFQIAGEEYATVKFDLDSWIAFAKGDYVMLFDNKYTLLNPASPVAINGSNKYQYTLKFESPRAILDEVNFELFDDTSLLVIDKYDAKTIYCKGSVVTKYTYIWLYINETPALGKETEEGDYWTKVPQYIAGNTYIPNNYVYISNVVARCLLECVNIYPAEGDYWTIVNTAPAFDFTTVLSPSDYADLLCKNMNRARPNQYWVVGSCISANPLMQAFSNVTCLGALTTICNLFQSQSNVATEHWIDIDPDGNFRININQLSYIAPKIIQDPQILNYTEKDILILEQGKNKGLTSITKQDSSNSKKITRLVALGSTKNLYGTYRNGSNRLMLPNRYYLDATNIDANNPLEGVMTWDNIYPEISHATEDYNPTTAYAIGSQVLDTNGHSFDCIANTTGHDTANTSYWKLSEGTVTAVITENVTNVFEDANLSFDPLDPQRIMADGTVPKVSFITGNLAGYQFPITRSIALAGGGYQLTISQIQDSVGSYLPTSVFGFNDFDQYVLVDLYMPQIYTDKAEQRLLSQAESYLAQYSLDQNSYDCPIDEVWATNNEVGFKIGQVVHPINANLGIDDDYRIITLKRNITRPYKQSITLSNLPYIQSSYQELKNTVTNNTTYLEQSGVTSVGFKQRTFRGAQEALDMAFNPDGDYYTEVIAPLTIATTAILSGTATQQFVLTGINFLAKSHTPNWIGWSAGSITDTKMQSTPRTWTIVAGNFTPVGDDISYYCYIRCAVDIALTSGDIIFSQTQYKTKGTDGYYYFLVGTLQSVLDNMRQFYTSYGFTFINGRSIVTGKVQGYNSSTYFDLDKDEIGGRIKFLDGLISGMIGISDDEGNINAGMQGDSAVNIAAWFGGNYQRALDGTAQIIFYKDGTFQFAEGAFRGDAAGNIITDVAVSASEGTIGNFNIFENAIVNDSIEFSDTEIEPLDSLINPVDEVINRVASWTSVGIHYSTAYTQALTTTKAGVIDIAVFANIDGARQMDILYPPQSSGLTGHSNEFKLTLWISDASNNTVFSKSALCGNDGCVNMSVSPVFPMGVYVIHAIAEHFTSLNVNVEIIGNYNNPSEGIVIFDGNPDVIGLYRPNNNTKIGLDGFYSELDALRYFYFKATTGLKAKGAKRFFNDSYRGFIYSNNLEPIISNIGSYTSFILDRYSNDSTSLRIIHLPAPTDLESEVNNFTLKVLMGSSNGEITRIDQKTNSHLYDDNGNMISYINMEIGDSIELRAVREGAEMRYFIIKTGGEIH